MGDIGKIRVAVNSHIISDCNGIITVAYTISNLNRIAFIAAFKK